MADQTDDKERQVKYRIDAWLQQGDGWFTTEQLDRDLGIVKPAGKNARAQVLHRLCQEGVLKKHASSRGRYCKISDRAPIIEWQKADPGKPLDLLWPFSLENWVSLYEKNIVVLAGAPNAGKTALLLNFIHRNMHRVEIAPMLPIQYFTSETGAQELRVRIDKFPPSEWSFEPRERSSDFADVIAPTKINIVDFLEVTNEFYLIAQEIKEIHDRLTTGIAIVAIQKNPDATLGRGGAFSLEKARMYLSMDSGKLTIIKGKNWAVEGSNPNGKSWSFNIVQGWKFTNLKMV